LTAWGVALELSPPGIAILSYHGLREFTWERSAVYYSTSLRQQYLCHAIWGRAIIGAGVHWDLEAFRPTNGNYANVAAHRCNWTSS
jgi:hypothetical protein